jgi:hypothetical protein
MNSSALSRGSVLAGMALICGLAMPVIAEAGNAKSRSSVERRQRPGLGYFANSPMNRARSSSRANTVSRPASSNFFSPDSAVARSRSFQQPMTIVNGKRVYTVPSPQAAVPQQIVVERPAVTNGPRVARSND